MTPLLPRKPNTIIAHRRTQLLYCNDQNAWQAEIVIAIAHKNTPNSLARALSSALKQTVILNNRATVLLLDDSSEDGWDGAVEQILQHSRVITITAHCGSPARARNCLLDYVDEHFPAAKWVARMDADDSFASTSSVEALCNYGDKQNSRYILGSNQLVRDNLVIKTPNLANSKILLNPANLNEFIQAFCHGKTEHELPSCNLILSTHYGIRYPNIRSAEDHWIVSQLLFFHSSDAAIVTFPLYANYSLDGHDTQSNQTSQIWHFQRQRLAATAEIWSNALSVRGHRLLGAGQEGVVWKENNQIIKRFYKWSLDDSDVCTLTSLLSKCISALPYPSFEKHMDTWQCSYEAKPLKPFLPQPSISSVKSYLKELYINGIATNNIKRDNLRIDEDSNIVYIDIGKDITPLSSSRFLDMCARLYAIAVLGVPDEEWVRRPSYTSQANELKAMPGFNNFYRELILELHPISSCTAKIAPCEAAKHTDITLMIKACAQDSDYLEDQVIHIVGQLCLPIATAEIVLLIDSYQGPFLREYAKPDFNKVITIASKLMTLGIVDKVLVSPTDPEIIKKTHHKWFGRRDIVRTHTTKDAPLFPQIWGFDQVNSRYVLQCDIDVLIGRTDYEHDVLSDMLSALSDENILSVGFNIPKAKPEFRKYEAPCGGYVPEVRFGMLDLKRINRSLPLKNPVESGVFKLTWHRAIEALQQSSNKQSVRGGDSRSFYIHPLNKDKSPSSLHMVRDAISNGYYPKEQAENFDLIPNLNWQYPKRSENIVFLLKGRNTSYAKLYRCINSLSTQSNQSFGVIFIDDNSDSSFKYFHSRLLAKISHKTTKINRFENTGRLPNFIEAIEIICTNPNTLIAILDQDDALMRNDVIDLLYQGLNEGADLIQLPMFRPNKPCNLYQPVYEDIRQRHGQNVWAHLRAFKKSLFEKVPKENFFINNKLATELTDYITMVPMAELAENPQYIDKGYCYFHERMDYSESIKKRQSNILEKIFSAASCFSEH